MIYNGAIADGQAEVKRRKQKVTKRKKGEKLCG
jgi:hypothetical protein